MPSSRSNCLSWPAVSTGQSQSLPAFSPSLMIDAVILYCADHNGVGAEMQIPCCLCCPEVLCSLHALQGSLALRRPKSSITIMNCMGVYVRTPHAMHEPPCVLCFCAASRSVSISIIAPGSYLQREERFIGYDPSDQMGVTCVQRLMRYGVGLRLPTCKPAILRTSSHK